MTDDPLNRYAELLQREQAPAHVSAAVIARTRAEAPECTTSRPTAATPNPCATSASGFSVKRFRFRSIAVAACAALAVGAGLLAAGPLLNATTLDSEPGAATPLSSMFGLSIAEAAEPGQSVQIAADESGITLAGTGGYDIRFAMNLTCVGEGIQHLSYTLDGDDVRFMGFDFSQDAAPAMESPQSFEVDYRDQNPEDLRREILVNVADPELTEVDAQLNEVGRQIEAAAGTDEVAALEAQRDELNAKHTALSNAYYEPVISGAVDNTTWLAGETAKAADKLADATLSVTATFADGTSATKRYRIAPVEGFEQGMKQYLDASFEPDHDEADPRLATSLFTIEERG